VVLATVGLSLACSWRDFRRRRADAICWNCDFHDLPARERVCRHEFTGEFKHRTCDNAFDCRECAAHAALVARQASPTDPKEDEAEVLGLEFPLDRYYDRGHAWAHPEADGNVTIGLDALASRLVAEPEAVELPPAGTRIAARGTAWRMRKRGADVRILSPLDGEVVATGGPEQGWYLKVKPEGGKFDARHLLRGGEIRPWLTRELERLQTALAPASEAPSLADGGVPVDDIAAGYPEANWDAVCSAIFLQP
jgi:glycine cleavage system H lipoate-binding protein